MDKPIERIGIILSIDNSNILIKDTEVLEKLLKNTT